MPTAGVVGDRAGNFGAFRRVLNNTKTDSLSLFHLLEFPELGKYRGNRIIRLLAGRAAGLFSAPDQVLHPGRVINQELISKEQLKL